MGKNLIGGVPNWLFAVAVIGLYFGGYLAGFGLKPASVSGGITPTPGAVGNICSGGATPSFDVLAYNKGTPGTALTSERYTLFFDGLNYGTQVGGTAVTTIDPDGGNKKYNVVVGQPGGATYYFNVSSEDFFNDCKENVPVYVAQRGVVERFTFYNEGTATNNTNATKQAMSADDPVTMELILKCSTSDAYCVDPNGGYITVTFDINTTEFDVGDGETEVIGTSDASVVKTSVPTVDSGVGDLAFKVTPTKEWKNHDTLRLLLKFDPDNTIAPGATSTLNCGAAGTAGGTYVQLRMRQSAWTVHSETGKAIYGVENDAGTAVLPVVLEEFCYS